MANTRPKEHSVTVTFKCTPADASLLSQLAAKRASDAAAAGFEVDASLAGYLRGLIRREAKAAGLDPVARELGSMELHPVSYAREGGLAHAPVAPTPGLVRRDESTPEPSAAPTPAKPPRKVGPKKGGRK